MKDSTENRNLNLQVKSIARLLDALGYPNPDDPDGDWGPIGPVVRGISWVALNPQPLPPRWVVEIMKQFGPHPDPWVEGPGPQPWKEKTGPVPDPWKTALLARVEIDRLIGLARMGEVAGGEREGVVGRQLAEILDDWCGTPPKRRWPLPWPFPFTRRNEELTIGPADLVLMGVQFQKAAEALSDSGLADDFANAANRLMQTGLEHLENEACNT